MVVGTPLVRVIGLDAQQVKVTLSDGWVRRIIAQRGDDPCYVYRDLPEFEDLMLAPEEIAHIWRDLWDAFTHYRHACHLRLSDPTEEML